MVQLPNIIEKALVDYIKAQYSGAYGVYRSFSIVDYTFPCVVVGAGRITEHSPFSSVYSVQLSISVLTNVDDVEDAVGTHDETAGAIFGLMKGDLAGVLNSTGQLHVGGWHLESMEQGREDRALQTVFSYTLNIEQLGA